MDPCFQRFKIHFEVEIRHIGGTWTTYFLFTQKGKHFKRKIDLRWN